MPGPPKKPTALKRYEGSIHVPPLDRDKEPMYPNGLPEKPKLSKRAAPFWKELTAEMSVSGVLKRVDRNALKQLCEDEAAFELAYEGIWKMAQKLKEKAKREGKTLPGGEILAMLSTDTGAAAMRAVRDLGKSLVMQRREFGLTPAARARIIVESRERPQDFIDDAIFNRPAELLVLRKSG